MKKIKNIAFWTGHYFGGAEKSIFLLAKGLNEYNKFFIFFKKGDFYNFIKSKNYPTKIISLSEKVYKVNTKTRNPFILFLLIFEILKSVFLLKKFLKKNEIKILHINNMKPAIIAILTKIIYWKFKLIIHFRGNNSFRLLNYFFLFFSDKIICITKLVKYINFGNIKTKKLKIVYNGIKIENLLKPNFRIGEYLKLGIIGYFYRWKNYELFIDTIDLLIKKGYKVKGYIYGDINIGDRGYYKELKQKVLMKKLENHIIFCGFQKNILVKN